MYNKTIKQQTGGEMNPLEPHVTGKPRVLLADTLLRDYVTRLEQENKALRAQLKGYYRQPEFHSKITKKTENK